MDKNCYTTACFAIFPNLMNTFIVRQMIPIVCTQIIGTPGFGYADDFKIIIEFS